MLTVRKSEERGHANRDWLKSFHSFSFAEYQDPAHMQYSVLRVINEDVIKGGGGFGLHPHRDMEIVTYVLSGQLRHQDSMGNGSVIGVGDVQRMSAGTGLKHSEFNASTETPVHLLQIWILPAENDLTPDYEEKHFASDQKQNQWCLIVAPNGKNSAVHINQDVSIYATLLDEGYMLDTPVSADRDHYLQVASGQVHCNDLPLSAGDAIKVKGESMLQLKAESNAEVLWFDLPRA